MCVARLVGRARVIVHKIVVTAETSSVVVPKPAAIVPPIAEFVLPFAAMGHVTAVKPAPVARVTAEHVLMYAVMPDVLVRKPAALAKPTVALVFLLFVGTGNAIRLRIRCVVVKTAERVAGTFSVVQQPAFIREKP